MAGKKRKAIDPENPHKRAKRQRKRGTRAVDVATETPNSLAPVDTTLTPNWIAPGSATTSPTDTAPGTPVHSTEPAISGSTAPAGEVVSEDNLTPDDPLVSIDASVISSTGKHGRSMNPSAEARGVKSDRVDYVLKLKPRRAVRECSGRRGGGIMITGTTYSQNGRSLKGKALRPCAYCISTLDRVVRMAYSEVTSEQTVTGHFDIEEGGIFIDKTIDHRYQQVRIIEQDGKQYFIASVPVNTGYRRRVHGVIGVEDRKLYIRKLVKWPVKPPEAVHWPDHDLVPKLISCEEVNTESATESGLLQGDKLWSLISEYVPGQTLEEIYKRIGNSRRIPDCVIWQFGYQALTFVQALQARDPPLSHNNLLVDNVHIHQEGTNIPTFKFIDFGIMAHKNQPHRIDLDKSYAPKTSIPSPAQLEQLTGEEGYPPAGRQQLDLPDPRELWKCYEPEQGTPYPDITRFNDVEAIAVCMLEMMSVGMDYAPGEAALRMHNLFEGNKLGDRSTMYEIVKNQFQNVMHKHKHAINAIDCNAWIKNFKDFAEMKMPSNGAVEKIVEEVKGKTTPLAYQVKDRITGEVEDYERSDFFMGNYREVWVDPESLEIIGQPGEMKYGDKVPAKTSGASSGWTKYLA